MGEQGPAAPVLRAVACTHRARPRRPSRGQSKLWGRHGGFNLHAQTKVATNDKKGRENLCKYILRPPLADTVCPRCQNPLRLIAMIETEDTIKKILSAMGLPSCAPKLWPARPPPSQSGGEAGDWLN